MPVILVTLFNIGDYVGRQFVASWTSFKFTHQNLWVACLLRLLFYPLFLAMFQGWWQNDIVAYIAMFVFSLTNGHFCCLCFIWINSLVETFEQELTANLMSFILVLGIFIGSYVALAVSLLFVYGIVNTIKLKKKTNKYPKIFFPICYSMHYSKFLCVLNFLFFNNPFNISYFFLKKKEKMTQQQIDEQTLKTIVVYPTGACVALFLVEQTIRLTKAKMEEFETVSKRMTEMESEFRSLISKLEEKHTKVMAISFSCVLPPSFFFLFPQQNTLSQDQNRNKKKGTQTSAHKGYIKRMHNVIEQEVAELKNEIAQLRLKASETPKDGLSLNKILKKST
ncbi:equilibrative nucleoside transporter (ENT8) [Reticulomyxa filosa]|uniref:Equilibrative nucleoside transporter (ENT8) n=1 Tax=Reticulomyxa filosa TaxID=46433 RepID=X6MWC6_RETFI|nr:equilibrative nucleoside transporter (ENT8) [Reticulomyxa filosa]|eukprot:ETO17370.1 equilibrative nucleoside transporter (ENT8) [Reticulomyxa filosa]